MSMKLASAVEEKAPECLTYYHFYEKTGHFVVQIAPIHELAHPSETKL
jgi:hypothetical protein